MILPNLFLKDSAGQGGHNAKPEEPCAKRRRGTADEYTGNSAEKSDQRENKIG